MTQVSIEVDGDTALAIALDAAAAVAPGKTFGVVRTWGLALTTKIKAKASGRPGPRAVTGDYRRSWSTQTFVRATEIVAEAGTNAPQGPRLEYGFTGVDAIGRHYNQPPYPHARPALDEISAPFTEALWATMGGIV